MDIGSLRVHSSWRPVLEPLSDEISRILKSLDDSVLTPSREQIFAALELPLTDVKCVIVGQDPYPTAGNAHGLAFSISRDVKKIPASLQNIFKELQSDLGFEIPKSGNLEKWRDQGVLLLNRLIVTKYFSISLSHNDLA